MTKKKILLVEDEPHLAFTLNLNLEAEGYEVVVAITGPEALVAFDTRGPFDAIILDGMLPEMDGFQVASAIRKKSRRTNILMLTARAGEKDRLKGFEVGVDDYIAKPFHLQELLARIKRATERSELIGREIGEEDIVRFGPCELDMTGLLLRRDGRVFEVTKLEADFLKELAKHDGKVLSREHLLQTVWGVSSDVETRTIDNFVVRIRKMLEENPKSPQLLISIRGKGYKLNYSKGS
ncbi:MAG: response regulator transcription factor [Proteobacteria bacterium]|nr:response regulator transcription factor [Pseudomonadota bacterium]